MDILNIVLTVVFICVGIALVVFVIELIKLLRTTRTTITDITTKVDPMLTNVSDITNDIKPTIVKIEPLVDRVQLTVDALNLEMMRVDEILEDVSQITDSASSATSAVDNITNAPIKAVNNVATKVRTAFGGKTASEESAQLAEQRVAVAQALEDYKAAQEKASGQSVDSLEPNFDGFEKMVSDEKPGVLDEAQADAATKAAADAAAEAIDATQKLQAVAEDGAEPASGDTEYFTYDEPKSE